LKTKTKTLLIFGLFYSGLGLFAIGILAFLAYYFGVSNYVVPSPAMPDFNVGAMTWSLPFLNWPVIIGIILASLGFVAEFSNKPSKKRD
jgi:hypothetical protein